MTSTVDPDDITQPDTTTVSIIDITTGTRIGEQMVVEGRPTADTLRFNDTDTRAYLLTYNGIEPRLAVINTKDGVLIGTPVIGSFGIDGADYVLNDDYTRAVLISQRGPITDLDVVDLTTSTQLGQTTTARGLFSQGGQLRLIDNNTAWAVTTSSDIGKTQITVLNLTTGAGNGTAEAFGTGL